MRQELNEFKRSRILDVACDLFYERGYLAATVDDIADRLNVAKPFIYKHFDSKDAILLTIFEGAMDSVTALLGGTAASRAAPDLQLADLVERFARDIILKQKQHAIFNREARHVPGKLVAGIRAKQRQFDHALTETIRRGVAAGIFDVRDPEFASLAIRGMVHWTQQWYREDGRLTPGEICRNLAEHALRLVKCRNGLGASRYPARGRAGRSAKGNGKASVAR